MTINHLKCAIYYLVLTQEIIKNKDEMMRNRVKYHQISKNMHCRCDKNLGKKLLGFFEK